MKVSGFTFLRNARINGYPFLESIRSVLPLVDEFICVIGKGQDDTRESVRALQDSKIRIIDTTWNESMQDRGFVYGQQKMIAQFNCTGDWAFYIEGDEIVHEDDIRGIHESMERNLNDLEVEALYFDFLHFYGTPHQIGIAGYRKAPRIIRNTIRTIAPDGLFWVVLDQNKRARYPRAKRAGGTIYHYGHCRSVTKMNEKLRQVGKYWGSKHDTFEGYGNIDLAEIRTFSGKHPAVMKEWIDHEAEKVFKQINGYILSKRDIRNRIRFWIETKLNVEISKKHFTRLD